MSTFIPPTPAATKSAEQHEEPSEQDSFNHLLFKVLRLTSEQVQDLNDWMIHRGTPNVHEVIMQSFRRPHALEDDLHFIREHKTCYIKAHIMVSLSLMITYIKHLRYSGKATHFGPFYYIQIDPQDYDEWRISTPEEEIHFQTPSKLGSPATPRSMATSEASESYITLTNFKKGIKRDASAYPILKNERYYNTFIRHFKATAKAQGLNTLMDPNFTPGSDEYEQQLFQEQQDFLYSVLISSLKTDFSEALVKDLEGDAQLILELLHEHHTGNSQYSRSEINRITKYLTNIKLDATWRGTNESFLMHYNDQLRLLDSLVDSDEKLPDNTRVTFLESAVESVPDLRRLKITDNVLQAQLDSTRPISYRSYFDLLKDAAFHLDQATKRGNKIRHTNVHFSGPNNEDEHQNLSSDDPQVIQQEDVSREHKTCYIKAHVMVSLSLMITYIKHLRYSGKATHFGPFYYIQIDPQDYDEWRISTPEEEIHFQTPSKLGSPATPRSMATSEASESYITLTNFKKGIKRDASAYPILKNERYYNTFIRHFKATAKAQGLNTLMDPNFTPGSDEYEQQLFQEQQDFLYSVLISSLKTDFSEALVKDLEGDAQLILELLHEHHTGNSQYSRSEINRITKYLTNIKLDATWRGTNESFLMHYNDQLRLLDSLVDSDEKLPDNTRVTFLESAVESVPDLRRLKITDNVLQAQLDSTRPISYRSYIDLLKDAAFHLDQATKRGNKIRHTNVHFSGPNNEDEHQNLSSDDPQVIQQEDVSSEPPEPLSYSMFQSHFQGSSTSNTQKIFLPKPIWEKLSKDQHQMIIDHNRSLPKSGSSSLSTPNKSPSRLPHKPTPQQTAKSQQVHTHQSDKSTADTTKDETTPSDPLLAMVHQSIHTSDDDASDITKVLSAKRSRQIKVCKRYIFQHANHTNNQLVDRGANGGLAGSDMRVIYKTHRKINISGIDNHEVTGLDVVTAATLLNTSLGKVIGIFNEYAYLGKGSSIHSSGQLEWFKTLVDEKSIKVGGTQLITTLDGYSVPLLIRDGLAYATSLGRPTDQDMGTYPHVFFTSPDEWDPSVLDHDPPHLDGLDPSQVSDQTFGDPMFDAYGDFNERIIANLNILLDAPPGDCGSYTSTSSVSNVNLHQSSPQEPDWNALHPFFAWTSPSSIKDTFNVTTRHGTAPHTQDYIKKHFKSRNPVFNIPRRSEAAATDTIFSDTHAVDDGSTMAQFFCGRDTLVCDAYGIKSTKQFINTLSVNLRKGEPWTPSSVMEANMKSPSKSLISSSPCSFKIISLNLIINIKIRQKSFWTCQALHQHCHEHLWLHCLLLATLFAVHLCCTQPLGISNS